MLKKQNRLARVSRMANEKTFNNPLFNLRVSGNKGEDTKFGFVVSKKVSKSAVIRNRTKRVLKSAAGEILENLSKGKNIVIISKKELEFVKKEEVKNILKDIFKKADILR